MEIHLGGLHRLVAKPEGDHRPVDTVAQKLHRGGMAQHVRRDLLAFQGGAELPSRCNVFGDNTFDRVTAESPPTDAGEHRGFRLPDLLSQPSFKQGRSILAQRRASMLPAFALTSYVGPGS